MSRSLVVVSGAVVLALLVLASVTAQPGLDYFIDPGAAIDALVRLDFDDFFATQPLMGSVSLLLRAPFVALVFTADERTVYLMGALPCVAALGLLLLHLVRRMEREERATAEKAMVILACLASPLTVKALHWGHPEELLTGALCVAAVVAARRRAGWAGLLLGTALATKQWALLAAAPVLVAAPSAQRIRVMAVGAAVAGAFTLPMLAGNPDRFLQVMRAAGSAEPSRVLSVARSADLPGAPVMPQNLLWPFSSPRETELGTVHLVSDLVGRLSHPLIVLLPVPLTLLLLRRRRRLETRDALLYLALLLAARGLLDPMSLDYYHAPLLMALAGAAAYGNALDARVALLATAGLAVVFGEPANSVYEAAEHALVKHLGYLLVSIPLVVWLTRQVFGLLPGRVEARHASAIGRARPASLQ